MGVHGLWRVLGACRQDETALPPGTVVGVDASLWIYTLVRGSPVHGAHVSGMLSRLCALLAQGLQPVFVFDGPPPPLKQQTLVCIGA